MSAFFIASIKVKSPELFKQYGQLAGKSMQAFNGEVVIKGKKSADLAGDTTIEFISMVKFPDQQHLHDWYYCEEYQALIPLRDQAAEITISSFDALT